MTSNYLDQLSTNSPEALRAAGYEPPPTDPTPTVDMVGARDLSNEALVSQFVGEAIGVVMIGVKEWRDHEWIVELRAELLRRLAAANPESST